MESTRVEHESTRGKQEDLVMGPASTLDDVKRLVREALQAEIAPIHAALEGISQALSEVRGKAHAQHDVPTDGRRVLLAPEDGPRGPTGDKGNPPPVPRALLAPEDEKGAVRPTGPRVLAAPEDGPYGPTGKRVFLAEPDGGVIGPTGSTRRLLSDHLRPSATTGERLILPTGAAIDLAQGARWLWHAGVLVVY